MRQLINLIDTLLNDTTRATRVIAPGDDPETAGPELEGVANFPHISSLHYPELGRWFEEGAAERLRRKCWEAEYAKITTDLRHGDKALRKYKRRLTGQWKLIAQGEASETPYHQWDCAFWLGRSADGSVYALRMDDYGDPDVLTKRGERYAPRCRVVAAYDQPGTFDESEIARRLMAVYEEHGGKYISLYHWRGRFDLGS
jgi:hypothetical protein